MSEEYSFGDCIVCGKKGALKYGKCPECQGLGGDEIPDIFKDIFNMGNNKEKKDEK